ncbi:MAG: DUF4245 domain-containing protein [Aeromicrobium sp.]
MADNRNASLGDMLRSIFVIGLILAALAGLGYWFQARPESKVEAVDYVTAAKAARGVADFKVLAPQSLPKGWKATTVRYDAGVKGQWHLGVLTDKDAYIGLEQTGLGRKRALEEFSPDSKPKGSSHVGGYEWQLLQSKHGETTLVRQEAGYTILVTGTATESVIESYVGTLTDH